MSYIETNALKNSTIMLLYSEREDIRLDPPYQRLGGIWTKEKKQLLIDSILNDYDVPKLYFHEYSREQRSSSGFSYAVVDGRQRLQTIWEFIDGEFSLANDFEFQRDSDVNLGGLGYEDIAKSHPKIRIAFDSFVLPVVVVRTDDEDLIEDMFSRLNEAVPLNAAEKRNAFGGEMVAVIREVAASDFFNRCVKFNNNRYKHLESAARMLLAEDSLQRNSRLVDTKKEYLDALAKTLSTGHTDHVQALKAATESVIDRMAQTFLTRDDLLLAQGNMVLYYLLFRAAMESGETAKITRRKLLDFREKLKQNRLMAAEDYASSSYDLLEFDRLSQQGTNDASNIRERFGILAQEIGLSDNARKSVFVREPDLVELGVGTEDL